jgi:tRNA G18 (ribose-2'-O)-methylase SpoU
MPITQYAGKERVVLMLGSEGEGLSGSAIATADVRLRIPIAAAVDSLNVATAAAIGLFQVTRGYLL